MEIRKIEVLEGNEIKKYDVLFTLHEDNKEFVVYTDLNSNMDIYGALYNEKEKRLDYISDPKDQQRILEIIKQIRSSVNS